MVRHKTRSPCEERKEPESLFVYAHLTMRIGPLDRGERFEDPLMDALDDKDYGWVSGGGTMLEKTGEISYCGIDIDLTNVAKGIPFVIKVLEK